MNKKSIIRRKKTASLPMPARVPKLGFYYHYKHDPDGPVTDYAYEVIGVGFHTEEARPGERHFVVYQPLYPASVYKAAQKLRVPCFDTRPLDMWMNKVEKGGKKVPRFQLITDRAVIAELEVARAKMY